MTEVKFDKARANRIAQAIGDCADKRGLVMSMRQTLVEQYKGLPRKLLTDTQANLVRDAIRENLSARKTISEASLDPMTSTATKIACCMPVMLGMEVGKFAKVSESYEKLAKFATQVRKAEGDCTVALNEFLKGKAKDYAKSAAAHLKSLIGMKNGKFFKPEIKAALVAIADAARLDLGEAGTDARNAKLAAKIL